MRATAILLFTALVVLPALLRFDDHALYILAFALIFASLALGWSFLAFCGLISFGHAAFFGVGAYTSALLSLKVGLSPWFTILLGAGLSSILALPMGVTCLRLKGPYFALATLAWAELLRAIALNWTTLTEGAWGLVGIPPLPNLVFGTLTIEFATSRTASYYLLLFLLGLLQLLLAQLRSSRLGLALWAIRERETRAVSLGIDTFRVKLTALAISGGSAGLAGALYTHLLHTTQPDVAFGLRLSILPLVMAMFGGMLHPLGPIVGTLVLYSLDELLQSFLPWAHQVPYALAILLVLLFLPHGVVGLFTKEREADA